MNEKVMIRTTAIGISDNIKDFPVLSSIRTHFAYTRIPKIKRKKYIIPPNNCHHFEILYQTSSMRCALKRENI